MIQRAVLLPRQPMPEIEVPLIGGGTWKLSESAPDNFTMVQIYRGLHCPICKRQLQELKARSDDIAKRGIKMVAISSDPRDRAEKSVTEWELEGLNVGYDLELSKALELGLFLSNGRPDTAEPDRFVEPALFLVRADNTLYFSSVQSMPFARPKLDDVLGAVDFVLAKDYPARGELESV